MELLQSKIPIAPADWTVARGIRYGVKLVAFILVPGLHQLGRQRWILGSLIFALYVISLFVVHNNPIEYTTTYMIPEAPFFKMADIAKYATWVLLAVDWKNLEHRSLKPVLFLLVPGLAAYWITQQHDRYVLYIHVEPHNAVCPAFCKNDIVEWEGKDPNTIKTSKGDYVVLDGYGGGYYTTKILSDPVIQACADDDRTELKLPVSNRFCRLKIVYPGQHDFGMTYSGISYEGRRYYYYYNYLVAGHLNYAMTQPVRYTPGRKISMAVWSLIWGVRPKKIGNLHQYFIYSEGVTDAMGRALLTIYKWTGINLFDLSKITHKHDK